MSTNNPRFEFDDYHIIYLIYMCDINSSKANIMMWVLKLEEMTFVVK